MRGNPHVRFCRRAGGSNVTRLASEMRVGEPERIEVRITRNLNEDIAELAGEVSEQ